MSGDEEVVTVAKNLNNVYNIVHNFIILAEKGTCSDISIKIRYLETSLDQFKEALESLTDVTGNETQQVQTIADLKRRLALKNSLISSFLNGQHIKNARSIRCLQCNCPILSPDVALLVDSKPFSLPLSQQAKNSTSVNTEIISSWWQVEKMFDFENIGFTHARDGVKYLICANCEDGPIGYLCPSTKAHFVATTRIKHD